MDETRSSPPSFRIVVDPIDIAGLRRALEAPDCGALVTFEGWVRDHNEGKAVSGLEYSAYQALAEKEGGRILAEARAQFGIGDAICHHRTGYLAVGGLAVWVGVSSGHRGDAFTACRYIIDQIKTRVPIWKLEHYEDGAREWVLCTHHAAEGSNQTTPHHH